MITEVIFSDFWVLYCTMRIFLFNTNKSTSFLRIIIKGMYFSIRNKSWHCYFHCWKFITFCSFNLRGKNGIMTTQWFQMRIATGCKLCCNPINKTLWKNHYFATDGDKSAEKAKWGVRFIKIQNHNSLSNKNMWSSWCHRYTLQA